MTEHQQPYLITELILYALKRTTDYDFTQYAVAAMERRLKAFAEHEGLDSPKAILDHLLDYDHAMSKRLVQSLTVTHSAFFRDAEYFRLLYRSILPKLHAFPKIRIWTLGCSTGEEVYSLAILLDQVGLLHNCSIIGTDINRTALAIAREGRYSLDRLDQLQENFRALAPPEDASLLKYVELQQDGFVFTQKLKRACHFREHNLVRDTSLGSMHLVTCRNVLIYLHPEEQERVIRDLLVPSTELGGYLMFGEAENITGLAQSLDLTKLSAGVNIYQNSFNMRKID